MSGMSASLSSRRGRLVAVLLLATVAISALAFSAAGSSMSYYVTPGEFSQQLDRDGTRWRVGGRVVEGTVIEEAGRPVSFSIVGDHGERMDIAYGGIKPNLFGPGAFVVVEGAAEGPGRLKASSVIIKHESEFFAATPTPGPTSTPKDQ
jgi:cytochrome c-type biogenesis protein CcmE